MAMNRCALIYVWLITLAALGLEAIASDEPQLRYELELRAGPTVAVSLHFKASETGQTQVALRKEWGGIVNDGADVTDLSVTDSENSACSIERESAESWLITHVPSTPLTVRYQIPATGERARLPGNDYRTRLDSQLFQMISNLGLLMPQHISQDQPAEFQIVFRCFDWAGWHVVSSFGLGCGPFEVDLSPNQFLQSIVMAGNLNVVTRNIESNRIAVAISGSEWLFRGDELADALESIVRVQRDFFGDHSDSWYLVTLTPNPSGPPGSMSLGGTALTNCFALYCTTNLSLDRRLPESQRTLSLLAHEYFHNWNGIKIPTAGNDPSTYWFSEGFTNFFARRMLLRAELITAEQFAADLSAAVQDYDNNPHRLAANELVAQGFWRDRHMGDLPYKRGELLALAIDEHIRQRSQGRQSLDNLILDLFRRPLTEAPVTTEVMLERIGEWVDVEMLQVIRSIVIEGTEVSLPTAVTEPSLELTLAQARNFDPGFNLEASREAKQVVGVHDQGNAYAAGLRDGQELQGFSVSRRDGAPKAEVVILIDGSPTTIEYEAVGPVRDVRVFRPVQTKS